MSAIVSRAKEEIKNMEFGRKIHSIFENIDFIDSVISKYLKNWTINRISKTDLSLMRLAVYEMKYNDSVPVGATINEIVDLAKIYSGEKDPAYINGVLGSISRSGALE